jgi:hypothetical protein
MYKEGVPDNKVVSVELAKRAELKKVMKRVMPFVAFVKEKVAEAGMAALDTSLPWDERTVLESNKDYIGQSCRMSSVTFFVPGGNCYCSRKYYLLRFSFFTVNVSVFRLQFLKCFRQRIGPRSKGKRVLRSSESERKRFQISVFKDFQASYRIQIQVFSVVGLEAYPVVIHGGL